MEGQSSGPQPGAAQKDQPQAKPQGGGVDLEETRTVKIAGSDGKNVYSVVKKQGGRCTITRSGAKGDIAFADLAEAVRLLSQ